MSIVAFLTLGCKVNQFETEAMEGLFKQQGYDIGKFDQVADVYVINTCSVTHLGERKSRQLIRRAIRANPSAVVAVTGCYAQISPEQVEAISGVDVIIGTQDRGRIVDMVEEAMGSRHTVNAVRDIMHAEVFEDIPMFDAPGRTRAFLKIQEGCTNFCTYCIIPYARGPLRSRSLASICAAAAKLELAGFKEIVLTGIHLGAYGRDMSDVTLVDAIQAVLHTCGDGLKRLRLSSLESIEVSDELIELMKNNPIICPHLHLPLQAGDDYILGKMNRHYTTGEYSRLIHGIQSKIQDIAISTDIIVGFPGETEAMFEQALAFVDSMNFAGMHIFPFSPRSGTPAACYEGQIGEDVKKHRVHVMQELASKKAMEFSSQFIGRSMEVLFEMESNGITEGLTSNYLRIYTSHDPRISGHIKGVKLEKIHENGLWGTRID